MVRFARSSCIVLIALLVGCTNGDPPGNDGGTGGTAGDGGSGGEAGAGGTAGDGGSGGEAGAGGTAGDGGSGGEGGAGGTAGDGGSGGEGTGGTAGDGGSGGEGGAGGSAGAGGMGGDAGAGGDDDPNAITIDGQLFFDGSHVGIPDAIVFVDGDLTHSTTTDTEGRFRIRRVVPPYDLTVVDSSDWSQHLVEFKGLTRANPALSMVGAVDSSQTAIARGSIGGVTYPLPDGAEIQVALAGVESDGFLLNNGGVKELYDLRWKGPASYSGSLVGVLIQRRNDDALDFLQAGAITPFQIEDDGELLSVELTLDQAIGTEVTTISADAGAYSAQSNTEFASFDVLGATFRPEPNEWRPSLPGTVSIPSEGARIALVGFLPNYRAAAATVVDAVPGGDTVLELPAEVVLDTLAPESEEVVATTTPRLEWIPVPGATEYEVVVEADGHRATWILPPTVTSIDVPDLGASLFQLPVGRDIWWTVFARTDAGHSPDEMADPDGMAPLPYWKATREYMAQGSFSIEP